MSPKSFDHLLEFFQVLADESRLKIVGLLANHPYSVGELADLLELREPTVSHHLARLKKLGLVEMHSQGNTHLYSLDEKALLRLNKDVFNPEQIAALVPDAGEPGWEQKVLESFVLDGRLTEIPVRHKKRLVILQWLAEKFKPGTRYTEREVNEIIHPVHPDTASLRRYMVDEGLVQRDHGIYWREVEDGAWRQKVLDAYIRDGQLTQLPAQRKKRIVILDWLAQQLDPQARYPERDLNQALARFHPDVAFIRREMTSWHFLHRERGVYWRVPYQEQAAALAGHPDVVALLSTPH